MKRGQHRASGSERATRAAFALRATAPEAERGIGAPRASAQGGPGDEVPGESGQASLEPGHCLDIGLPPFAIGGKLASVTRAGPCIDERSSSRSSSLV